MHNNIPALPDLTSSQVNEYFKQFILRNNFAHVDGSPKLFYQYVKNSQFDFQEDFLQYLYNDKNLPLEERVFIEMGYKEAFILFRTQLAQQIIEDRKRKIKNIP